MRGGFQTQVSSLTATLFNPIEYAEAVHEGTRPHAIYPVARKALYWSGADHPVKSVMHPGSKGNPFMQKGLDDAQNKVITIFEDALKDITEKIADSTK